MSSAGAKLMPTKYRGIVLGHPRGAAGSPLTWYRFRQGREIAIATANGLPREWMLAYVKWHQTRGESAAATILRAAWLAAPVRRDVQT